MNYVKKGSGTKIRQEQFDNFPSQDTIKRDYLSKRKNE